MIININRELKPEKKINDGASYAKDIGADKFFEHFIVNHADDMDGAIKTAPGAALMFMIQTHIKPDDSTKKELLNVLCERLCKNEAEYKKYFSAETCEG